MIYIDKELLEPQIPRKRNRDSRENRGRDPVRRAVVHPSPKASIAAEVSSTICPTYTVDQEQPQKPIIEARSHHDGTPRTLTEAERALISKYSTGRLSPFTIVPPPILFSFPRKVLTKQYGADPVGLAWANTQKTPPLRFLLPNALRHPATPTKPGDPGLLIWDRAELTQETWSLFTHSEHITAVEWMYVGQYQNRLIGELSAVDFKAQRESVSHSYFDRLPSTSLLRKTLVQKGLGQSNPYHSDVFNSHRHEGSNHSPKTRETADIDR
jgi:hypothetical protein